MKKLILIECICGHEVLVPAWIEIDPPDPETGVVEPTVGDYQTGVVYCSECGEMVYTAPDDDERAKAKALREWKEGQELKLNSKLNRREK